MTYSGLGAEEEEVVVRAEILRALSGAETLMEDSRSGSYYQGSYKVSVGIESVRISRGRGISAAGYGPTLGLIDTDVVFQTCQAYPAGEVHVVSAALGRVYAASSAGVYVWTTQGMVGSGTVYGAAAPSAAAKGAIFSATRAVRGAIWFAAGAVKDAIVGPVGVGSKPARLPSAREDYDWFYSDPARVEQYRGQYVSVLNRAVVGHGTAREAYDAAKAAGADSPLLFEVPDPDQEEGASIGL